MEIDVINNQATCANLKRLIEDKGYTPKDIQKKLKLESVQTIYKWYATARGKGSSIPSVDNMLVLTKLLQVKLDDIYVTYEITF
ncbi:MAG: helix-turn-helix transcriptional regulator [Lachnospiraceae bacterium]|nr:helix-turn-helix transcriptional regulator [Lachnospiraceae bacterium]